MLPYPPKDQLKPIKHSYAPIKVIKANTCYLPSPGALALLRVPCLPSEERFLGGLQLLGQMESAESAHCVLKVFLNNLLFRSSTVFLCLFFLLWKLCFVYWNFTVSVLSIGFAHGVPDSCSTCLNKTIQPLIAALALTYIQTHIYCLNVSFFHFVSSSRFANLGTTTRHEGDVGIGHSTPLLFDDAIPTLRQI